LIQSIHGEKYDSIASQRVDLKKGLLIGAMYFRSERNSRRLSRLGSGLLLGHAVHGAESPDQVAGKNRYYFSRGKYGGQGVEGNAIVGIVEDWNQHDAVGDVEIGVAGGEAAVLEDYGRGHGELDYVERLALLVGHGSETAEIIAEWFVICVFGIGLDHGDYRVGSYEAGQVIDVAVSVVADDAFA
jgi:hypothetical protein